MKIPSIKTFLPIFKWAPDYRKEYLSGDLSAGITVGVMLIPQGMAYAMLAGLPPIYGLYASTIALFIYAIMGSAPQLAIGPVAMVSLLVGSGLAALGPMDIPTYIGLAALLAMVVGLIQFAMGSLGLGFLVNLISRPVLAGYTSAAAIIISLSQAGHLFGIELSRTNALQTIVNIVSRLSEIHLPTLAMGLGGIALLFILKKINPKLPTALIAVGVALLVSWLGNLHAEGVKIVGTVPAGLPSFQTPPISWGSIQTLIPTAFTIALIGFMESIAVAKAIHQKQSMPAPNPNQELRALGLSNFVASLFSGFPINGGFSRTAVNQQAGAKSPVASIISALVVILTLLFLTPLFYHLPKAILASIITVAVVGLIDIPEAKYLWKTHKPDFALFILTAILTLGLGVQMGILSGIVLSVIAMVAAASRPQVRILDQKTVDSESGDEGHKTLTIGVDARLFFGNVHYIRARIDEYLASFPKTNLIVLDCRAVNGLDSSALHMLSELKEDCNKKDIQLKLSNLKQINKQLLKRAGLFDAFSN